jgi:hypothetical protein
MNKALKEQIINQKLPTQEEMQAIFDRVKAERAKTQEKNNHVYGSGYVAPWPNCLITNKYGIKWQREIDKFTPNEGIIHWQMKPKWVCLDGCNYSEPANITEDEYYNRDYDCIPVCKNPNPNSEPGLFVHGDNQPLNFHIQRANVSEDEIHLIFNLLSDGWQPWNDAPEWIKDFCSAYNMAFPNGQYIEQAREVFTTAKGGKNE